MENHAWRMTRLVEDLLTLSKIESDDKELHFEKTKIDLIIKNVIDSLSSKAKLKKIKFSIIKNSKKLIINADQDSIIQVFIKKINQSMKLLSFFNNLSLEIKSGEVIKCDGKYDISFLIFYRK